MLFNFKLKTPTGDHSYELPAGSTILFVGANGGGKTRLAVNIESQLGKRSHRISAHRALTLDAGVPKIRKEEALHSLRTGYANTNIDFINRDIGRWSNNAATFLLNDYQSLIQFLFAEQSIISLETHNNVRNRNVVFPQFTAFEKLNKIWEDIFPHRILHISGDDIRVSIVGSQNTYSSMELSDGERAVFYLIGQVLAAEADSLIIFDEPELHIHRSIMSRLWDELEALRPDCAMVLISHDLEFAASRAGQKFVLKSYSPEQGWEIEKVPEVTGFTEEITTLILGSRKPILFVEGQRDSLDLAVYRACYPTWTVIPRNSCEEVLRAVATLRANDALTRLSCAGIVDADDYSDEDIIFMNQKGVGVLPVSEIENLFLLPEVIKVILKLDGYSEGALEARKDKILDELFDKACTPALQNEVIMRHCRRKIDRTLKKIDLSASSDIETLARAYSEKTSALDINDIARTATANIETAIQKRDAVNLLRWYNDKGLLAIAGKAKNTSKQGFEQWILRALNNGSAPEVMQEIRRMLPEISTASTSVQRQPSG